MSLPLAFVRRRFVVRNPKRDYDESSAEAQKFIACRIRRVKKNNKNDRLNALDALDAAALSIVFLKYNNDDLEQDEQRCIQLTRDSFLFFQTRDTCAGISADLCSGYYLILGALR